MPDMGLSEAMLGSAALGAGGSIFSSLLGSNSANQAIQAEQGMFNQAAAYSAPFIGMGRKAINPLMSLITPGKDQTSTLEQTPGYQFALSQGEKGVTNQATMGGLGGNVLRGGANYAAGLASNTWSDVVNKLMTAVNTGASTASSLAGNATAMGGKIGDTIMSGGGMKAGGVMGAAGALGGGLQNLGILNWLNKSNGGGDLGNPGVPWGSSPNYGGGNMYSGDAYGGNANNPLPGLGPADYGPGY
jgi:hypothetical protein